MMHRSFTKLVQQRGIPRVAAPRAPREAKPRAVGPRLPNRSGRIDPALGDKGRAPAPTEEETAEMFVNESGEMHDGIGSLFQACADGTTWLRVRPDGVCELLHVEDGHAAILDRW
jgi:hypothetical protein